MSDPRSRIPSVDALVASESFAPLLERFPRPRVVDELRASIDQLRREMAEGSFEGDPSEPAEYARRVRDCLEAAEIPSLRRVINATGVVLHTNLGRAPLARAAVQAMAEAAGACNLEYDLEAGARGSRYTHCVSLLTELTGAEDALVVNNAAAGLVLALNTAALGRGVAVSRGELVEIGGGFRIPEVLERAGARLVEVGSTNRTRAADYRTAAADPDLAAILKVHRSNFRISGFTEEATVAELVAVARERDLPLIHDLGSGLMVDAAGLGLPDEPRARESIEAGAGVVVVSGDKLLGGPQAGVVVGRRDLVAAMRSNPLCRALRVDKVTLAGLEATLRFYRDVETAVVEIPALAMLAADPEALRGRAETLCRRLGEVGVSCRPVPSKGAVGGGTFPGTELASWALAVGTGGRPDRVAAALRDGSPPVVGRIVDEELILDLRTVLAGDDDLVLRRVSEAVRGGGVDPHFRLR